MLTGCTTEITKKEKSAEKQISQPQKDNFLYLEKDGDLLLLDGIASNDIKMVEEALQKGIDINYKTKEHWIFVDGKRRRVVSDFNGQLRPLPEKYTFMSDEEIAQKQLQYMQSGEKNEEISEEVKNFFWGESKTDLEGKKVLDFEEGGSPLELASKLGYFQMVRYLLENSAFYSERALFLAVKEKHIEVVQELLKQKRNLNILFWNKSPLSISVENNDKEMVMFLVENGAEISFSLGKDAPNIDAFDVAMRHYNTNIVELLLEYKSLKELWKRKKPPLHWVINNNPLDDQYITEFFEKNKDSRIDMLSLLLEKGADINEIYRGKTPLMEAMTLWNDEERAEIIQFLTDKTYGQYPL